MRYLWALTLAVTALQAEAQLWQAEKPLLCGTPKQVLTQLSEDYKETVEWLGKDASTRYVLMTNRQTGTWTLVQFTQEWACILGTGTASEQIIKPDT